MLFSKDIFQKIKKWIETGNLGKLAKEASENENPKVRIAAYKGIGRLQDQESVRLLLDCFRGGYETDKEVLLTAADALGRIGTKKEFDVIFHLADQIEDPDIVKALHNAAVEVKDHAARW